MAELQAADFNGDGKADIFYGDGSNWRINYSANSSWQVVNSSATNANNIKIGDFNNDGNQDVFHATGTKWIVSYSGTSLWNQINTSITQ